MPIWLIVEESVNNKTDAGASRHPELLLGSTGRTAPYAEAPQEKRRSCRACKSGKMGLAFRWKVDRRGGEHYVLYQLHLRGLLAAQSPTRAYAADILVLSPVMGVGSMVQVKTRTSGADGGVAHGQEA